MSKWGMLVSGALLGLLLGACASESAGPGPAPAPEQGGAGGMAGGLVECCECDLALFDPSIGVECTGVGSVRLAALSGDISCNVACERALEDSCGKPPGASIVRSNVKTTPCPCLGSYDCDPGFACDVFRGTCNTDCTIRGCEPPFECQSNAEGKSSCTDTRPSPACIDDPAGQAVPFRTIEGGRTVHFTLADGCVPIEVSPDVVDQMPLLTAAVDAWRGVECSELCLEGPVVRAEPLDGIRNERGIYVRAAAGDEPEYLVGTISTFYLQGSGRLVASLIELTRDTSVRQTITVDEYLYWLGASLGLGTAAGGLSSVMSRESQIPTSQNRFDAPTALDEAALCALYGAAPYCGE